MKVLRNYKKPIGSSVCIPGRTKYSLKSGNTREKRAFTK